TREPWFGHFNAYPLREGVKPPTFEHAIPSAMFAAARLAGAPGLVPIVQLNHPRMGGIGYFELLRFDGEDVARWRERSNLASLDFDAIELFNGDHYAQIGKVEDAMKDWTALLKAGFRPTATGNSDSHKLVFAEAGVPRNLVKVAVDDPEKFDAKDFVASMRAGHVVVVSGPFIRLKAGDKDIGDDVPEGDVELDVEVDAAPWVDVSRVDLVVRGEVAKTWTAFDKGVVRLREKTTLHLNRGDFVIAIARGSKAMTYLHRGGARPFSFTNPIFAR
ncbi:MAG TPA: CehA/McbA family metallohydrolase, partial [Byssovorax sp.]